MKRGQVFTFAETHAPRAGMTISETLFMSPEEHATIFSIAAGTDISEEFYPHPYLYMSLSGETRVETPSLRVLPEGSALLIPRKTPFRVLAQDPCVFLEIEAKEGFCMNLIKTDEVFALKDLLPYEEGKIVNADIVNNPHMKMALMSFDAGCATPEHAAGGDAISIGAEKTVNDFLAAHNVEYPLAKGYGMTEVSSAATIAAGTITKPGSVGIPMVNTLVSVFEPGTTKELPIGERGELCICSPSMMKGYYGKPEETANILRTHEDGRVWAHTGDVGYMDEDGFVYLDSRIKRLIIRHDGFKVFPSMIENVISQHPAVHQCSVVGCTDKDHVQGRLPFVFVVLKPEAAASAKKRQIIKELRQMCAEELAEYVQPVGYKFLDAMPMTPVGKFDYRKLETEITSRDY